MTTTPNMNLPVPVPGTTPGPDWATQVVADMNIIDSHDHTNGKGVPITPDGMNVNADLPLNDNNLTEARSLRMANQSAALVLPTDLLCVYVLEGDLYYIDSAGNNVRITQGGTVTGSTGTITGLPSGTASAAFAAGTFTWEAATNTPATMAVGPLVIGRSAAGSKTVTITPNAAQASNYDTTLPAALPSATSIVTIDASGNYGYSNTLNVGFMPIGSVIATFPNLTGAYSCSATTAADSYGFVKCNGQTINDATSPMDGDVVPNINNDVFLAGSTTAGSTGGNNSSAHTHSVTSNVTVATQPTFTVDSHTHEFAHTHMWTRFNYDGSSEATLYTKSSSDPGSVGITTGDLDYMFKRNTRYTSGSANGTQASGALVNSNYYTTGVIDAPSGSGNSAATSAQDVSTTTRTADVALTNNAVTSGAASYSDNRPSYITALYIMRIK